MTLPNFLWISLEDCSPRFGCYGDPAARTPNIDRLAAQGTVYRNAFCTSPVCSPSRTTVITGYPATAMGAQHMRTTYVSDECAGLPTPYRAVPPPFVKCFTEQLRAEGYYCTNNGKTDYQFEPPFLPWDANGKPESLSAIHWRNRPSPEQPFFAVFNLEDTHESHMWPDTKIHMEAGLGPVEPTDPASLTVPPFLPDTPEVRTALARQYDNIAHNDRLVGMLLRQLEEDGLTENTFVMLWSDHGEGLPRAKRFLYDSGIRVPLIIRGPGFAPGKTESRLVSLIDLAPTVYDCAGLPAPVHFAGQSLLTPEEEGNPYIFAHRDRLDGEYDTQRCVRSAGHKYIRNYHPYRERFGHMPYRSRHEAMQAIRREQLGENDTFDTPCPPEELFDLESDPHELNNLASDPAHRMTLRELRRALDAWQARSDPDLGTPESQLAERFWPGGRQPSTQAPLGVVFHPGAPGGCFAADCGDIEEPALLQLYCSTEGASIGYRAASTERWIPYRLAIRLAAGEHVLELKAERHGYSPSETASLRLTVRAR